jgi:two-component system, NtrC family, response regulator HydG
MSVITAMTSYIEAQPEAYVLFDRQYRIVAINEAFQEYASVDSSVIGRTCYDVSHQYTAPCDQSGETCPMARSLVSRKRECDVHLHHTPHGEKYVNIELTPIRGESGEIVGFIEKMGTVKVPQSLSVKQGLVGQAPSLKKMLELASRVAQSDAVVMLSGESGTGKELTAQAIHQSSRRGDAPFIPVDCSGIPETLFESELFGHERGSFTGATSRKMGLVEAASGGTLFLDEVGEIPLSMQVKLLRLLETGTFRRVGSTELLHANVRIISATHRDLPAMIKEGRFRADLYYRINIFPIHVPSLRERMEDLPLLAKALLSRLAPERKLTLSPEALQHLLGYSFPGNVRELRNLLERATLLCDGNQITQEHLILPEVSPPTLNGPSVPQDISDTMLREWLENYRGGRKDLAKKLGMSERTLYRRIRELESKDIVDTAF